MRRQQHNSASNRFGQHRRFSLLRCVKVLVPFFLVLLVTLMAAPIRSSLGFFSAKGAQGTAISFKAHFGAQLQASSTIAPMPVISRNVPAYTNNDCGRIYPASNANNDDYATFWRSCMAPPSASKPIWLAYDLSKVPLVQREKIIVAWYGDLLNRNYDLYGIEAYNIPKSYTIDVDAAPDAGTVPTSGWVTRVVVTNNTYHSRQHLIQMAGYNWVRLAVTASNGMANNYDVALKMDIHDASQGTEDDWMFYGDLMAEYAMARNPKSLGTFAQLVHTAVPSYFPVQEDGSNYSFTSADGALHMKRWLRLFPGHFVALSFGTNDANSCISPDSFYKNYDTMVQAVLNAGKIPVIPTIPWGRTANIENCAPALNAKISSLYSVYSQIIHGPDLWSFFQAHQDMITGEAAPLTTAGIGSYRQQWTDQMVKEVYALNVAAIDTPQLSLVPQQSPTPVPQLSPTPVLQLSPTPMPTLGSTATPTVTGGANAPSDGQGVYESCLPGDAACLAHLNIMASKGFKLVLNYSQLWASDTQEIAYADRAQALGMKVIWAMNDPAFRNGTDLRSYYSGLASTCNCSDNAGFIRYVVNLVKDLPGTWGYYIGDEVDSSNHAQVKAFSDLVHQADPFHPRLFIGSSALPAGVSSVLSPFADTADVLGLDYYPVGRTDIPNAVNATAQIAKGMQAVDDQTDKQSAMVLQAISLGEYPQFSYTCRPYPSCVPYPTVDQMNLMYNLTMQNAHPRLVLWYSYFDILRSDNPAQHWTDLCTAIAS